MISEAPHNKGKEHLMQGVTSQSPSRMEYDPVFAVYRHAVHQSGPQALVKLGDELRKILHALDITLDLLSFPLPFHLQI